jgi:CO/xanthine dehydrogenase FAD-binding subunit
VPAPGEWFYTKAMRRRQNSASIVTVAAVVTVENGTVASVRIALGGVGPRPLRATAAEAALTGRPFDRPHVEAAADAALEDANPFDDAYASAWYRRRVLPVHIRRALLGDESG